jgi:hypothetical protein
MIFLEDGITHLSKKFKNDDFFFSCLISSFNLFDKFIVSQYIIIAFSGGLFNLAVRLMQLFSTTDSVVDYVELTSLLGLYFQVRKTF